MCTTIPFNIGFLELSDYSSGCVNKHKNPIHTHPDFCPIFRSSFSCMQLTLTSFIFLNPRKPTAMSLRFFPFSNLKNLDSKGPFFDDAVGPELKKSNFRGITVNPILQSGVTTWSWKRKKKKKCHHQAAACHVLLQTFQNDFLEYLKKKPQKKQLR